MGKTYQWQDAINLASKMVKGVPFNTVDALICDVISADIWKFFPWQSTLIEIPAGTLSLSDGNQDYTNTLDIYRLTKASLVRTDLTTNYVKDIDVSKSLAIDPVKRSPYDIRQAAFMANANKIRLESAPGIPSGVTWEFRGEYQPNHTKITDLTQNLWMDDELIEVPAKGVLYWAYRLSDDPRAGEATYANGKVAYSGQLAAFMAAMQEMASEEDFGNIDGYFPEESLITDGRRVGSQLPFGNY